MGSLSTIAKTILLYVVIAGGISFAGDAIETRVGYLNLADDPDYQPNRAYAGIIANEPGSPKPGAELAIKDTAVMADAVGRHFTLVGRTLAEDDDPAEALHRFVVDENLSAVIVDLPLAAVQKAALAPANRGTVLFNVRHRSDDLRQSTCGTDLFHVVPSQAMIDDAIAEYLVQRNWRRVLLLEGTSPDDMRLGTAFRRSAKKFGLKIVASKPFVIGNDPRKRDQINIQLMTSDSDYDVVFVAEAATDFARYVPYQTYLPRPVVGSSGLQADAWHFTWERQGAPQLTRRFLKIASRPMTEPDWAAWMAIRAIVNATVSKPNVPLGIALMAQDLTLDGYKGAAGSFRTWDRQLRQPILLHTADAVVAYAPVEGFLHETNTLDTLGLDKPEFTCPAK